MTSHSPRLSRSKSSHAPLESLQPVAPFQRDHDSPLRSTAQRLSDALDEIDPYGSYGTSSATAKLAALVSPCYFHRRFDDAVNIEKVLEDIAGDESMSHSRLVQTATGVREVSKQLQRRPIRRAVRNIMIVTKARDNRLVILTRRLTEWLLTTPRYGSPLGVNVYVDEKLRDSKRFDARGLVAQEPRFQRMLRYWSPDLCWRVPEKFDLVLTLGGDGTVLFTSWLFQRIVPPILSFSLGSLGFLTPFGFDDFREHLNSVMGGLGPDEITIPIRPPITTTAPSPREGSFHRSTPSGSTVVTGTSTPTSSYQSDTVPDAGMYVSLRMRFTCTVFRAPAVSRQLKASNASLPSPAEACQFEVLNELVIDRGPSPYVSNLELFGDDELLTVIQADGVIFSTPTGSTAYSLSAGGSLVHPSIPAILLTPICPHTLSFRPMLLNDTISLRIAVPRGSRAGAWCSFDGKGRIELRQGDYVSIRASRYPFATVVGAREGWIDSVSRTLRWNTREARQKGWNGGGRTKIKTRRASRLRSESSASMSGWDVEEEDEPSEEEERRERDTDESLEDDQEGNEEEFDIDFDDEDLGGGLTPGDSGYGDDGSSAASPAAGNRGDATGSPQRKLSLLSLS